VARIPGVPKEKTDLLTRYAYRYSIQHFGKVVEPLTITAHHTWISRGVGAFEWTLQKARRVDEKLKALAALKAAALVGCPF
jgi:hypothetical protein